MKTDTIYGILASAHDPLAVQRVSLLKDRDQHKPFIVLIADFSDLRKFFLRIPSRLQLLLEKIWPGPVSVIFDLDQSVRKNFYHIHRGLGSIAFRIPDDERLRSLLRVTGPLIAPSANPQGEKPATSVEEAMEYFGSSIDYYEDAGTCYRSVASSLISFENGEIVYLRKGKYNPIL